VIGSASIHRPAISVNGYSPGTAACSVSPLVVQQGRFDEFRATQMIQDKAQAAVNGLSFTRTATPYWIIWVAPFGRVVKRSSAVLRLLVRTRHYRRDAPGGQPLRDSLTQSI
jgi:hypothetical protein